MGVERAAAWAQLPDDERKRRAMAAARDHDAEALWALTEDVLRLQGLRGGKVRLSTLATYRTKIVPPSPASTKRGQHQRDRALPLLVAWTRENLLRPSRHAGATWVRQLEARGCATATVRIYIAAAKALYGGFRATPQKVPLRRIGGRSDGLLRQLLDEQCQVNRFRSLGELIASIEVGVLPGDQGDLCEQRHTGPVPLCAVVSQ